MVLATSAPSAAHAQPPVPLVERRIVSVFFCDLASFTSLSEHLDSEDVATVQQSYFTAVADAVGRYCGVVEKYIGDAVMAVFVCPAPMRTMRSARCGARWRS